MLKDYILNYHENLQGQRDFIALIAPFLEDYRKKVSEKHDNTFRPLELARKKHLAETEEEKDKYAEELRKVFDGDIVVILLDDNEEGAESEQKDNPETKPNRKIIRYKIKGDTSAIDEAFKDFEKTRFHKEQLYKNSLIGLLSTVEWFFSQILHFYYDKYPEAAGIKSKTLTLDDLKSFGSIKDAEEYLIENKIEEILRGSIKDWFKVLKDDVKLGMGYKDKYEEELIEIYQRRNLLVHNGEIVNSIYLSKISNEYKEGLKIGDKIEVSKKYLENAISKLELVFTLVACELWKKLKDDDEERVFILMNLGYKFLLDKNWDVSECANYFICGDKKMPIANRTAAQLNVWLCKKENGKYDEIKKEVEEIDYSDKSLIFQVALSALKGDKDFFFEHLPQVLRTEELSPRDLFEFPILREMRETEEFEKFKQENETIIKHLETVQSTN
jgi:hypothetical protein